MTPPPTTVAAWEQPQRRPPASGCRVVCYLRTANPGSVGQRLLARQRAKLEVEVAAHGWTAVAWVEDLHQSGTTLDRPGLRQALALLADRRADGLLGTEQRSWPWTRSPAAGTGNMLAGRQGWQLLTLTSIARSTSVVDASRVAVLVHADDA